MIDRVTAPDPFPPPACSHASVAEAGARLAFLAGSVPLDTDGKLAGPGDPVGQAECVPADPGAQPRAAGSGFAHVVGTDVYVVSSGPAVLPAVWDVVEASGLSAGPHVPTLMGVACPGYTGQSAEITATAVVPDRPGGSSC
ncbi:RidA family protein [Streptomyces sp. NPDC052701]|uniref:RidA family protein n=1 Tax=Streptomyces sp. NPDC052701 TaxID=3155533 RepID=UPI0034249719